MKKSLVIAVFFALAVVVFAYFISAAATIPGEESAQINKSYQCLKDRIAAAPRLTIEEAAFSGMALGDNTKITDAINRKKKSNEFCWSKETGSVCDLKTTAQVALAYGRMGDYATMSSIARWLMSKNATATDLNWFLEIDLTSHQAGSCTVSYSDNSVTGGTGYAVNILDDMTVSIASNPCLTSNQYWLSIANTQECLKKDYYVQCNGAFKSSLLYKKPNDNTIFVVPGTLSSDIQVHKIRTLCFKTDTNCDYEGSLWALYAISKSSIVSQEVMNQFKPYLLAFQGDSANVNYFPSAFLYLMESQDQYDIMKGYWRVVSWVGDSSQKGYWKIGSNDEYDDTPLGMLSLRRSGTESNLGEFSQARNWLLSVQQSSGCWNGNNIKDTAFVLFAGWPRGVGSSGGAGCGNGVLDSGETCDYNNLVTINGGNRTCSSYSGGGYVSGEMGCKTDCTIDFGQCSSSLTCGNGAIETGEECEATNSSTINGGNLNCTSLSLGTGTISCTQGCKLDKTSCSGFGGGGGSGSCESQGKFCIGNMPECTDSGGTVDLMARCNNFLDYCCSVNPALLSCTERKGVVCNGGKICDGAPIISADSTECCLGSCIEQGTGNTCTGDVGVCRGTCEDNEESNGYSCSDGLVCCQESGSQSSGGGTSIWVWIIILAILILLIVLAILYRDKIRLWWSQYRGKVKTSPIRPSPSNAPRPMFPFMQRQAMPQRTMQRTTVTRTTPVSPAKPRDKEMEDTMKRLRDMSK